MNRFLEEAILDDLPDVVEGLIAENPHWLEHRGSYGQTPLMLAVTASNRSLRCIQALIDAGADVNATNGSSTVLHWVVSDLGYSIGRWSATSSEVISLLVEAGARLEAVDRHGWTPLMRAIIDSGLGDIKALLDVGANPDIIVPGSDRTAFNQGQSLLSLAWFNYDSGAVIEALLETGADVNLRDDYGRTSLEYYQAIEIEKYQEFEDFETFAATRLQCIELLRQASTPPV